MAADDVRRQIGLAMFGPCATPWDEDRWQPPTSGPHADRLDEVMAVVDRIAREAAGKALRDAADDPKLVGIRSSSGRGDTAAWLRARAEAAERGGQA